MFKKILFGLLLILGGLYFGALYVGKQAAEKGVAQAVAALEEASGASIKHEGLSVDSDWRFRYSARLENPSFFGVGWMARQEGHLKFWIGEDQEHAMLSSKGSWLISRGALITEIAGEWEHEIHTPGYNLIKGSGDAKELYEAFRSTRINFKDFALSVAPIDTPLLVVEEGSIELNRTPRTSEDEWNFTIQYRDVKGGKTWSFQNVDVQSGLQHLTQEWIWKKTELMNAQAENSSKFSGTLRTLPLFGESEAIFPDGEVFTFQGSSESQVPYWSQQATASGKGGFRADRLRIDIVDEGSARAELGLTPALRGLIDEWVSEVIAPAKVTTMAEGQIQSGIVAMREPLKEWVPEFADWGEIKSKLDGSIESDLSMDFNQLMVECRDFSIQTDLAGLALSGRLDKGAAEGMLRLNNYQVIVDGVMKRAQILGPMVAIYEPALVKTMKEMGGVSEGEDPSDLTIPLSLESLEQFQVLMQKNLMGE